MKQFNKYKNKSYQKYSAVDNYQLKAPKDVSVLEVVIKLDDLFQYSK